MANADVTRSHPVKQVKDSMQQDENGIPVNEIAQNKKNYLIQTFLRHLHHE